MRIASKTRKWRIARELGVNLDSVTTLELLGRDWVTMEEGAHILEGHRANLFSAMERGTLTVESIDHGTQRIHRIKTDDLMAWAAKRRPDQRVVNAARAERYRQFDAEESASALPQE
jgi:hypothetical protein